MKLKISNQPIKGFRDFTPNDWLKEKYIFNKWSSVCKSYGYEEYNGPLIESVEIYNKSGDDIGLAGKELYTFTDRGDRKLAIRPEMTPTVGRMISSYAKTAAKPIRWYSIAQFFRAENPQRGRGREFYQLNADIFGDKSINSDIEVLALVVDLMLSLGATEKMFKIKYNDRVFMNKSLLSFIPEDKITPVLRIIDGYKKKPEAWLKQSLIDIGLDSDSIDKVNDYLALDFDGMKSLGDNGIEYLVKLQEMLEDLGISQYFEYDSGLARGFDYYTGLVFEVYDMNPENNRSMFGGGRYDNLTEMFGGEQIPAVGFAPGDITTLLFLESWDLFPNKLDEEVLKYYIPFLYEESLPVAYKLARKLRLDGSIVVVGTNEESINKALSYASKNDYSHVILIGQDEFKSGKYKVKNLVTQTEESFNY